MMCECPKDFIDWLIAAIPLFTALLVAWIAFRQYGLGRDKIRLDLYERRFAAYEATLIFYQALTGASDIVRSETFNTVHRNFIKAYRESQFLFKSESGIFDLLGQLHERSFKIIGFKTIAERGALPAEVLMKMSNESLDALEFFNKTIAEIESRIDPYLDFRRVLA